MTTPPRSPFGIETDGAEGVETEEWDMSERIDGQSRQQNNYLVLGIAFGITAGAALGLVTGAILNNTAIMCVGMGFGVAIGMAIGVAFEGRFQHRKA